MKPKGKRIFSNNSFSDIFFCKTEANQQLYHQPKIKNLNLIRRRNLGV